MTRHLVRLIWNRKRQNLLLTIEIFCAFLVVFVVALFGLTFTINARPARSPGRTSTPAGAAG